MFSLNIDVKNPKGNPDVNELKSLGVEMVRYTFYDNNPGDNIDPGAANMYRSKADELKKVGIGSLVILTYDTYPNKPPFDANWGDYINRFANRSRQIAELLAPFEPAFQIWNEADHDRKNVGTPYDPCVRSGPFGQMLRRTHDAIKSVNPNFKTVVGGLASGNHTWLTKVMNSQGGQLPADYVAFHPYGQRPEPNWPRPDWAFGYFGDLLNNYYKAGKGKPVWITEMGIKEQDVGNNREQAAEFLRKYYKAMSTKFANQVEELFWFCYSDGMVPTFGLKDQNLNPKPIYEGFRQAVDARPAAPPPKPAPKPAPAQPKPAPRPAAPTPLPSSPPLPLPATPAPPTPAPAPVPDPGLTRQVETLKVEKASLKQQIWRLEQQVTQLSIQVKEAEQSPQLVAPPAAPAATSFSAPGAAAPAGGPSIQNITQQLKHHPTKRFRQRPLNQVKRIIIHHTGVPQSFDAAKIAAYRVDKQGWPSIGYHFFITPNGQLQQTNQITTMTAHSGQFNADGISVCFAGDFNKVSPSPAQIEAGARLVSWLLKQLNLPFNAMAAYRDLDPKQASPGAQWNTGVSWGNTFRQKVQMSM